jgi:hypothetical protein
MSKHFIPNAVCVNNERPPFFSIFETYFKKGDGTTTMINNLHFIFLIFQLHCVPTGQHFLITEIEKLLWHWEHPSVIVYSLLIFICRRVVIASKIFPFWKNDNCLKLGRLISTRLRYYDKWSWWMCFLELSDFFQLTSDVNYILSKIIMFHLCGF